jgi:hypothetical protein
MRKHAEKSPGNNDHMAGFLEEIYAKEIGRRGAQFQIVMKVGICGDLPLCASPRR